MQQLKAFFQRSDVGVILVWLTILLGIVLRVHQGDLYPINQNDDGLFYAWTGLSMFEDISNPMSLTIFESAENEALLWRSQYKNFDPTNRFGFRIAENWFDHPPLGQLLIALPAKLLGFSGFSQLPQMVVRTPALLAAVATLFFTYLLGKELFSFREGWWSLLFLAVWPLAVWSGRQSYLENILNPLWLGGLYGVWRYTHTKWKPGLWIAVLVAVLSGWIKLPGFAIAGVLVFWLASGKKWKEAVLVGGAGVASLVSYLVYGMVLSSGSFLQTIGNQGVRGSYLSSLFVALTDVGIYEVVRDGWWFLGLLALVWLWSRGDKGSRFVALNGLFWVGVVFLTSGMYNTSPWYRYPLYPLMAIALGVTGSYFIKKPSLWWGLWWAVLGLTGWELAGFSVGSMYLRVGLMVIGLVFAWQLLFEKKPGVEYVRRGLAVGLVGLAVVGNMLAIWEYPQILCEKGRCLSPTKLVVEPVSPATAER